METGELTSMGVFVIKAAHASDQPISLGKNKIFRCQIFRRDGSVKVDEWKAKELLFPCLCNAGMLVTIIPVLKKGN